MSLCSSNLEIRSWRRIYTSLCSRSVAQVWGGFPAEVGHLVCAQVIAVQQAIPHFMLNCLLKLSASRTHICYGKSTPLEKLDWFNDCRSSQIDRTHNMYLAVPLRIASELLNGFYKFPMLQAIMAALATTSLPTSCARPHKKMVSTYVIAILTSTAMPPFSTVERGA